MKKNFPLTAPGKDPQRVLELVRSDVGRYVNREKRKSLPEGHDRWEFSCRIGADEPRAVPVDVKQVHEAIGNVAATGAEQVFVEIHASARPTPVREANVTDSNSRPAYRPRA